MGAIGNLKNLASPPQPLDAAATLVLPAGHDSFVMSGTATVTDLQGGRNGRVVLFRGLSGTTTFTNTNGTTTRGQMDLGGSNVALAADDILVLVGRSDGSWLRLFSTDN
jgi:hypothetical protein